MYYYLSRVQHYIYLCDSDYGICVEHSNKIQANTRLREWFDLSVYRLSVVRYDRRTAQGLGHNLEFGR